MIATVTLTVGTKLVHDGEVRTVVGIEAERLRLRDGQGRDLLVHTATALTDPATSVLGVDGEAAELMEALGPLLDNLAAPRRAEVLARLGHVREVLTGYVSGTAERAADGEPRAAYDPSLPLMDRYAAKAAEVGVDVRTVRRWVRAVETAGAAGLVDGRTVRLADPLAGIDERWLAMCRLVLDEHTEASRPTRRLLLERVTARLDAEFGQGAVPRPGRRRARAALEELSRGTNALVGATAAKRSIAGRPKVAYGRLRSTRPGEYVLLDTTPLDVFAMEPLTLRWVRVELTIAFDLYSRCVTGLRLSPVSTKSVDAVVVLYETLMPDTARGSGGGLLPYAGLPDTVVVDAGRVAEGEPGLPGVAAETVVVDHGKIFLSKHLLSVCGRLGVSIQPARPLTPTDKAAVERFFRTLREGLLAALPGYKGPDVHSRGKDPEGCAYFFVDELEAVIRQWIVGIYHRRPHGGLVDPAVPGLELSPAEMFAHGLARAGRLRVPARADLVFDLLPVAWRTIQHYGVEVNGLRYNGPALTGYRNRRSPFTGLHPGKWPVRYDTDDVSRIYFQDPADQRWHTLVWEHATEIGLPFSEDTLGYARRLVLAEGRHVDDRLALAELLERWDAGLVRHPAERRMAIRASEQRQARLAAAGGPELAAVAELPAVRAVVDPPGQPAGSWRGGDDDSDGELDGHAADEPAGIGDEEFYADALKVVR
ncbi:Mu transposase C-terminal domain-containing protein [Pseudofrankia sp. BMG5.37]|uniref:Mu transposase C-terminal domain-containing protein n=1 Tax=Pseudofrankia sp. BMG5.37 TaxID=3050035 RepID=UPI00289523B3|nr:Mu transposase C-terminal domain-containing protein [Pseudofrankia sp. BMG5.37]MDT3446420.1 Mu transposase C-terminal domain-containing protein [Pseudofrankia sp. BMG5.37]